jgi:hypothetical protein
MTRTPTIFFACLLAVACSDDDTSLSTCVPGEIRSCPCAEGEPEGIQECLDDETFGNCDCGSGSGDTDSDSDVDTDTDTDNDTGIFSDSFETKDMSATNADGFIWGGNNRTSVVTQDPIDGPVKVYENGVIYAIQTTLMPDGVTIRDWTAHTGDYSLQFKYYALDSGVTQPNWTEQRFDFGKGYPDIWFSYHIRVPSNYVRGPDSPSGGRNNKFMIFLMAPMTYYSDPTVSWVEVKDRPNLLETGMNIKLQTHNGVDHSYTPESTTYVDFITPADAERWMHVVFHLKASSDNSTPDGVATMYRKWENEDNFTYITGYEDVDLGLGQASIDSGYQGWGSGYFLGWANDPYAEQTEWLVDDFTLSATDLWGVMP